ncbi:MAG: hypothetical protein OXI11_13685 [Gammaproteobacteria bacterium]|nr:hypothetical protein [Gammaproteobacteria bacterium]
MDNNRRGGLKLAFVAVLLAVALVVLAYVYLTGEPEGIETPTESAPTQEQANAAGLPEPESVLGTEKNRPSANSEPNPDWETSKKGDKTEFSLTGGEIGYVDVASVVEERNPYSVVALLQNHQELTGVDESVEITIDWADENERWGYEARFHQLIAGQPAGPGLRGRIFFSSSGAVARTYASIVDPEAIYDSPVLILQPEAEAIALEAAIRYAATLPVRPDSQGQRLSTEILPGKMLYELDAENKLRRVWRIPVAINGPKWDTARVLIDPGTGKVIDVRSSRVQQAAAASISPCDNITFRVCNAQGTELDSCAGVTASLEAGHQTAKDIAASVITRVAATSSDHIERQRGLGCEIDVVMESPLDGAHGEYDSDHDIIRIDEDLATTHYESTIAHEVFHALSQTPSGAVEHGLVYAMEALYLGGDENEHWIAANNTDFTTDPEDILNADMTLDPYHTVAHTIYRVFQTLGADEDYEDSARDTAFQFALEVDIEQPTDTDAFHKATRRVGDNMGIGEHITAVLVAMGIMTDLSTCDQTTLQLAEDYTHEGGIGEDWIDNLAGQGKTCDEIESIVVGWIAALIEADAPMVGPPTHWPGNWPPQRPTPPGD